jgi:hypothetical protein
MNQSHLDDPISIMLLSMSITTMSFNLINHQIALIISDLPTVDDLEEIEHQEDLEIKKHIINEHPIFSRIESNTKIICNFCKKIASYNDMENNKYCWFHRSQYE